MCVLEGSTRWYKAERVRWYKVIQGRACKKVVQSMRIFEATHEPVNRLHLLSVEMRVSPIAESAQKEL